MGIETPADLSGSECSFTSAIIAVEELAKVDASVAVMCDVHNTLVNTVLRLYANDELKQKWLPGLATDTVSAFCISSRGSFPWINESSQIWKGKLLMYRSALSACPRADQVNRGFRQMMIYPRFSDNAGSDAFALQTTAKKDENGDYILNGSKW
jgi:alkylation response protein AidB-like acyl-CoA dehydrogenase